MFSGTTSAVVYLRDGLTDEEFLDDQKRLQHLEDAVQVISTFPELQIERRLPSACAVAVKGPLKTIRRLSEFLRQRSACSVTIEDARRPVFRSAW
jgi:hypothetical protein